MKNEDQPIYPCLMQQVGEDSFRASKQNDPKEWNHPVSGLSKREYFAGLAMQGLLANSVLMEENNGWEWIANSSVNLADRLLKRLENES